MPYFRTDPAPSSKSATLFLLLACVSILAQGLTGGVAWAEVREYRLTLARHTVNPAGKPVSAMTVNDSIPGPVLEFTEGDTALIKVHNNMDVPTSIHWHGILVPPGMDGVPDISFPAIAPGKTFTYRFPIRQSGTYWYHSHSGLQEQRGVYGAIVIHPRGKAADAPREYALVLSDWTNQNPRQVLHNLKRGSEWYSLQKGASQSLLGAAKAGMLTDYFKRELARMPPMDISDVAYDAFLANGKPTNHLVAKPGETVRIRLVNGSSTTFFHVEYAAGPMTIVAADGMPVQPVKLHRLLVGVAETYDLLIKMPPLGRPELRATAHDTSSWASLWLGDGPAIPAPMVPPPNLYRTRGGLSLKRVLALSPAASMGMPDGMVEAGMFDKPGMAGMDNMKGMKHAGTMAGYASPHGQKQAGHATMAMPDRSGKQAQDAAHRSMVMQPKAMHPPAGKNHGTDFSFLGPDISSRPGLVMDGSAQRPWPPYARLKSPTPTAFDSNLPRQVVKLTLDGDMERYVWFLNNKALSGDDDIRIKKGHVVRFIMINRTMMHHPMHLHGHFFRVLNGQGDHAPWKHTVDVEPMSTTVIEFKADEFGDWFFHCHLLYHMMSGMARLVHYEGFKPPPEVLAVRPNLYKESWYAWIEADLLSNMTEGVARLASTRHVLSGRWKVGWQRTDGTEWEFTPTWDYVLDRFKSVFAGANAHGLNSESERIRGVAGIRFLLPMNIESTSWLDTDLGMRFELEKNVELTPRLGLFGSVEYDTHEKWEGEAGMSYLLTENLSLVGKWHSDYGWGGGLRLAF